MTVWPFPRARYIDHDADLHRLVTELAAESLIALDTESNSLYAYQERVCLVQISTRTADYILDPLRIADMSPLGTLLADGRIEKVFHAAEYDLMCLKRDYGFVVNNLFDTMIAARVCGLKHVGLNRLLAEYCGVIADKSHQRDDWGERPLTDDSLLYAQMDTHYLPILRDHLHNKLAEAELTAEAEEIFREAQDVEAANNQFDPDGFWRIAIPNDLTRRQTTILRELYLLRDELARERDCPPFKVFTDHLMVALASAAPNSMNELKQVEHGLSSGQFRRYGHEVLRAVERGKRAPMLHVPPRPPDIAPPVVERFAALRDWRRERAESRGVESDVIISKNALWALAHKAPTSLDDLRDIPGLGPWRLSAYGEDILDVMQRFINSSNHSNGG
jgi:ribonuclease D